MSRELCLNVKIIKNFCIFVCSDFVVILVVNFSLLVVFDDFFLLLLILVG